MITVTGEIGPEILLAFLHFMERLLPAASPVYRDVMQARSTDAPPFLRKSARRNLSQNYTLTAISPALNPSGTGVIVACAPQSALEAYLRLATG